MIFERFNFHRKNTESDEVTLDREEHQPVYVSNDPDLNIDFFDPDDETLFYDNEGDEDSYQDDDLLEEEVNHKLNMLVAILAVITISTIMILVLVFNKYQNNLCRYQVDTNLFSFRYNPDCLSLDSEFSNYQLNASGTITVYPNKELDKTKSFIEIRFISPLNISKHSLVNSVLSDYETIGENEDYVIGEFNDSGKLTKVKVIQRQQMAILICYSNAGEDDLVFINNKEVCIQDVMQQVFDSVAFSDNIETGLQEYNNEQTSIRNLYDSLTKEHKMTYKDGSEIYYDSNNQMIFRINDSGNIEFYDYDSGEFSVQVPNKKINLVNYFKVEDQEIYYGKNP